MPPIGRINPSNSNGGAIHKVDTPKPFSTGSKAMDANPVVKKIMDAKKERRSVLLNILMAVKTEDNHALFKLSVS